MYDTEGECFFEDARTIDPGALPDIDLICGGFPCQSFSVVEGSAGLGDLYFLPSIGQLHGVRFRVQNGAKGGLDFPHLVFPAR